MGKQGNLLFKIWVIILVAAGSGCQSNNYFSRIQAQAGILLPGAENGGGGATPGDIGSAGDPTVFGNTNCVMSYPVATNTPATNTIFNESDVLAAFSPQYTVSSGYTINVWYTDEHAMTLGVREIDITTAAGTTTTSYPVSPLTSVPGAQSYPQLGATAITGDQAGVDVSTCSGVPDSCSRPIYPALFVTDITADPNSTSGDWQYGGAPILPDGVYGTWKAAVRKIDKTQTPEVVSVLPDPDPPMNHWDLGAGVPAPTGLYTEGYTAVVSWEISHLGLQSGHIYRMQFMVHDGDQRHTGGDVGENCVNMTVQ